MAGGVVEARLVKQKSWTMGGAGYKGNGKSHKMSSFTSAKRKGLIWV